MILDYLVLISFIAIGFCTLTLIPAIFPIATHMNSPLVTPVFSLAQAGFVNHDWGLYDWDLSHWKFS